MVFTDANCYVWLQLAIHGKVVVFHLWQYKMGIKNGRDTKTFVGYQSIVSKIIKMVGNDWYPCVYWTWFLLETLKQQSNMSQKESEIGLCSSFQLYNLYSLSESIR